MAFKGFLTIGKNVTITFFADPQNQGNSSMLSGFVPPVGPGESRVVRPGLPESIMYHPLPNNGQLRIKVMLPQVSGGILEVTENGEIVTQEQISKSVVWDYLLTTELITDDEEE